MAIPIKYNFRHVILRWRTTALTIFAIALVIATFVSMLALANGLSQAFATTGDPQNLLVLRGGATAETNSSISREQWRVLKFVDEIARDADGEPLASPEAINIVSLRRKTGDSSNAIIRGVGPKSMALRPQMRIVEGRDVRPGLRELIVGTGASARFANAQVGGRIKLVKSEFTIVGRFDAAQTAADSEFWGDVEELNREFDRTVYSSILVRAPSIEGVAALQGAIDRNQRLAELKYEIETDYYQKQTSSAAPIQYLGTFIAIVMAVGAIFAAMNTMYAAISSRGWEIATLRILGFSRRSILISFVLEAMFLAFLGGVAGCLMALPINGVTTGTSNFQTFSEVAFAFRITPSVIAQALGFSLFMGFVGGLLPALQASRQQIVGSMRDA